MHFERTDHVDEIRTHPRSMHNAFGRATRSRGIQNVKRVIEGELFKCQWVIFGRGRRGQEFINSEAVRAQQ